MRCPFCKDTPAESRVVDSRESAGGLVIRRRRECLVCKGRFTTYERLEEVPLVVVKKDGRREPFDRAKVLASLAGSCRKRPVAADTLEALADEIERALRELHEPEVASTAIGELMMERLREVDKVAYVRYASFYREFREPQDFMDELRPLLSADDDDAGER